LSSVFERRMVKKGVHMGICLHGLTLREGERERSDNMECFLYFVFIFLVAEQKGSGRTYDTTDG
jgi:hypothetical protein